MNRRIALIIYLVVAGVLLAFVASMTSEAVRLTSDADEDQQVVPVPPPPRPPMPPVPPVDHDLVRLIGRVRIDGPYHDRGLSVFVLRLDRPENRPHFITLDEGITSGDLTIEELKAERVPQIRIRNRGRFPAFLMAGELITGGKQNRTIRNDTIIPPSTDTWFAVPVYCVEQHRWSGGSGKFAAGKAAAPNAVRSGLNQDFDQAQVWREVRKSQAEAGIKSRTGDVTALYSDAKSAAAIEGMTRRIIGRIPRRQTPRGLVIAHGRRIVSADLFANSHLYHQLYEKIIRSHAVEVWRRRLPGGTPGVGEVRSFLDRIRRARITERPAPNGHGTLLTIRRGIGGSGITYGGDVIHAALFWQRIIRPLKRNVNPGPRREDVR